MVVVPETWGIFQEKLKTGNRTSTSERNVGMSKAGRVEPFELSDIRYDGRGFVICHAGVWSCITSLCLNSFFLKW